MRSSIDPYAVLGVSRSASAEDVTNAYRLLAREYHPDRLQELSPLLRQLAEDKMKEVNAAYRLLRDRVPVPQSSPEPPRPRQRAPAPEHDAQAASAENAAPEPSQSVLPVLLFAAMVTLVGWTFWSGTLDPLPLLDLLPSSLTASTPQQAEVPPVATLPPDEVEEPLEVAPASSPSFDCNGRLSLIEREICGSPVLSGYDREVARLYATVRDDPDPINGLWVAEFQVDCQATEDPSACLLERHRARALAVQRDWLDERNRCASQVDVQQCLAFGYQTRIEELGVELLLSH